MNSSGKWEWSDACYLNIFSLGLFLKYILKTDCYRKKSIIKLKTNFLLLIGQNTNVKIYFVAEISY